MRVLTGCGRWPVGSAASTTGRPTGESSRSRRTPLGQRETRRRGAPPLGARSSARGRGRDRRVGRCDPGGARTLSRQRLSVDPQPAGPRSARRASGPHPHAHGGPPPPRGRRRRASPFRRFPATRRRSARRSLETAPPEPRRLRTWGPHSAPPGPRPRARVVRSPHHSTTCRKAAPCHRVPTPPPKPPPPGRTQTARVSGPAPPPRRPPAVLSSAGPRVMAGPRVTATTAGPRVTATTAVPPVMAMTAVPPAGPGQTRPGLVGPWQGSPSRAGRGQGGPG
ncbi:hypothetical protein JOF35_007169 [Streptomyces demainii]|uniref:Uncharacterized protein n=1 Tax=Streptomyces demainii TaxID=588122 RepID=A0ABT9L292_9ACTN|nr:hypothetical protein [Streptomyces demainii]